MADLCGNCIFLDPNDCKYGDEFYCKNKHTRVKIDEKACSNFRRLGNGNSSDYQRAGCYITTIICEILEYDDTCEILELMREFRENVLKPNSLHRAILQEYDQIGPIIAERLRNEKDKKLVAMDLLRSFLIPCAIDVKYGRYDDAILTYQNMVQFLKVKFCMVGYDVDYSLETPMENLGKGRIRTT